MNEKRIGIIQPGRIGDIVICLPIAKYYYDLGYKIIWPICYNYIKHFQDYIDYVNFVPITNNLWKCINEARNNVIDCKRLELAFSYPNTPDTTLLFDSQNIPFDELKYKIANVPFDKKWVLDINRNTDNELKLYNKLCNNNNKYIVYHCEGSGFKREIKFDNIDNFNIITLTNETNSIFDWLMILEQANKLVLVDSCIANMVEQLNISNSKYFIIRSPYKITPTLRNKWIKV